MDFEIYLITIYFQNRLYRTSMLLHILFGGFCFAVTLIIWAYENKSMIRSYILKRRQSFTEQ